MIKKATLALVMVLAGGLTIKSPKVACLMHSHKDNLQKQRDSFATWGQDCNEFLAFSNEAWEDKEGGFKTIEIHPEKGEEG